MMSWKISLRMFLWMMLLTGVIYPAAVFVITHALLRKEAEGSLLTSKGVVVGSSLIAQQFQSDHYFWSRPSVNNYDAQASGGSNLGPTSKPLKDIVTERRSKIGADHGVKNASDIPLELLFASGSGLDPVISPACAYFQVDRVLRGRGKDPAEFKPKVMSLIDRMSEKKGLCGCLEEGCVNVLALNIALDELYLLRESPSNE